MAEATAGNMLGELKAITECSICTETFQDPRILPCIHTFCLKCMQQMAKQGSKKPGDKLSCPICRKEITVSDNETMGLQKNFFMARLIEMVMILKPVDKAPLCNICLLAEPEDSSAKIEPATMYCLDCRDALCPECSVHHKKQRFSRDHRVISLGSDMNEQELLEKSPLGFCDEHKKEQQKLYCMDCKMLACVLCFVESHRLHDCRNVSKVADELRPQIIADVSRVSGHIAEMVMQKELLENETTAFLTTIAELENEVLIRSSEVKELVEVSTASVLEELSEKKKQRLKEIAIKKDDNETHHMILKTFQTYCNGIISKGTDGDVCRVANDLSRRTEELHKLHQTHLSQDLPSMKITFQITKLDPSAQQNIIGTINVGTCGYQCINEKESPPQKANLKALTYRPVENFCFHQKPVMHPEGYDDNSSTDISSTTLRLQTFRLPTFGSVEYKEEFHFFGGKESPLHLHHKAEFHIDGVKYNFVEQYVLHKKAEMCKSTKDIAELMKITDPNHLKQFDKKYTVTGALPWETKREEFTKKGYVEKSRQVKTLFDLLLGTKGKHLVYATRRDSDLGIGVDANDPLSRRKSNWKGKNLLGEWLMEVREKLPNELECSFEGIVSRQEATGSSPRYKGIDKEKDSSGPEKFTFFWRTESPFSQWHPCSFVIDDQWYNCAEQYMMHQKAVTFGDHESAQRILKSKDPLEQKKLGRGVAGFDDKRWSPVSMDIVKKGNLAKFGQNEKLKGILFETAGTTLVEASPVDSVWGIGLDAKDPRAMDRKQWRGKNQLGQVLTEVREELMRQERENIPSKDGGRSLGAKEKGDAGKSAKIKANYVNPGQERKSVEGVTDARVSKGHDPTALRKETDQRKGDSQSGNIKKGQTQKQNSSQRKDKTVKEESNDVEMRPEVEQLHDQMSKAENQDHLHINLNDETKDIVESHSLPKPCDEAPLPVERMEYLDGGKEKAEEVGDPAWEGFNAMELDIDEDSKDKKKREGSKDDYPQRSDNERMLKKGKTGENYRREHEKIDDQALPEKFTFFWSADSPFSQHHPANFVIDGTQYNCAEQYMMHQKTVVFHDERIGREIMYTSSPAKQKSLAKQIEGFDDAHWKTLRRDVVKKGNIAKFSQNPRLRRMLFATAGTTMVEASPIDYTWGIGLSADDPKAWLRRTWSGGNMLGDILTEVR